jgi:glycosyltransferase involved in cell wall biosynthesis
MISMNEAAAVGPVIDLIRQHCPAAEVLLVDSSKDDTPVIAEQRGARVIRQFPPRGYGPAMTRLLYSATTDVIVTMDCDGTYPADQIRAVHERIERGADLVNAARTHHKPKAMPWSNYLANRAFAATAAVVHGHWTTDLHSGMRAYRTSMLRGVFVPEMGLALPVELLLLPVRHGYRVDEVPIDYFDRIGVTTLHRWKSTVWTFKRIGHVAWTGGVRRG